MKILNTKLFLMFTLILVSITLVSSHTKLYGQPQHSPCYDNDQTCTGGWSQWTTIAILVPLDYDPTQTPNVPPTLQGCNFMINFSYRYCLNDFSNWQIDMSSTGPPTQPCINAFYDFVYPPGGPPYPPPYPLNDANCRIVWEVSYRTLAKWMLQYIQNLPLQPYGDFTCPTIFKVTKYSPGSCQIICLSYDINHKPVESETPCAQDFCCGILYYMCWDTSVNPPVSKIIDEYKISEGSTECLFEPKSLCPPSSFDGTHCFSDCLY